MTASAAADATAAEPVLVVDDERAACEALARTVELMGHPWQTATRSVEALGALRRREFALVLSDIRIPDLDGVQLLRRIVADSPRTAVMMVTAILDRETAVQAMRLGAYDYVVKPFEVDDVIERMERALERRRQMMERERGRAQLEREVAERTAQVRRVFLGAVQSLATALDARDGYTHGHSRRVTALAVAMARQLGVDPQVEEQIRLAGMLHDIGKIGIRESVLHKARELTPEEYAHIQTHPVIAQHILAPLLSEREIVSLIRAHHEHYDGRGYPDGLAGDAIPLGARILAVADAFDAMTSQRPYRACMSRSQALQVLRAGRGRQWDPAAVDALERLPAHAWRGLGIAPAHAAPDLGGA